MLNWPGIVYAGITSQIQLGFLAPVASKFMHCDIVTFFILIF